MTGSFWLGLTPMAIAQQNLENLEDVEYWRELCDLQATAGQSAQESSQATANPEAALALFAEAQVACEAAIELAPQDDSLWARHSGILLAQDQYPNAIASAGQSLRFNPENSLAFTYRCISHYELGNLEMALDACNDALRVDGSWGNQAPSLAWQYRGRILAGQGDPESALVAYLRTLLLEPEDSRTLLYECQAYLDLDNYDSAVNSCQAALSGTGNWGPESPALAWFYQGVAYFGLGDYPEAVAAFDRSADIDPLHALTWAYQGRVLSATERYSEALLSYTQAVAMEPDLARGLVGQCSAFNKTADYASAQAACEAALQMGDNEWWDLGPAEGWAQLAQALAGQGSYEDALAAANRAVGIRPDYVAAWSDRGVVLWYLEDYGGAIASTQQAIQLDGQAVRPWANLGSIFRSLGQYPAALEAYDNALQWGPNEAGIWANRSVVLWHLGQYEDSILSANRAVNLNPRFVTGWYNRGTALVSAGRYGEAVEAFTQVINLDPNHANGWTGLGVALNQLGRYDEARFVLAQALGLNPQQPIAQAILASLPPPQATAPATSANGNAFPALLPAAAP
ncbi:MAG: tetratricopeptide repeat protein [Cyanobacteria bacterium]|nr:tetratricopeptide repeat protein [Cyanobacteriota bacterium]MDA0865211.1 tetratricopeptide repeat protein [Cyanobacteriota bacterium]